MGSLAINQAGRSRRVAFHFALETGGTYFLFYAGINVKRDIMTAFALSGGLIGLARRAIRSIVQASRPAARCRPPQRTARP